MSRIFAQTLSLIPALALAAALVGSAGAQPATAQAPAIWSATAMPWFSLPAGDRMGALPQTIAIPSTAWAYGARSDRIDAFGHGQPAILRLDVDVQAGSVGVVMVGTDGSTLLNNEVEVKSENGPTLVYIRVRPATAPGFIILRNYGAADRRGSVVLRQAAFIREGDLSNEELGAIVQYGLH